MSYLLDTNVVSELRKRANADANVRGWASKAPAAEFHISVVTLLELERGILLKERRDPQQGAQLRLWLEQSVLREFVDRTLPIDIAVARQCAHLHVPNPKSERDALIAATALVHGLTVVTRNIADFEGAGIALFNPWQAHA